METCQAGIANMQQSCRVTVLVKALPQPSSRYGETVCCAGITAEGKWKRLYPVRFRHLSGTSSFKRWDWVEFSHRKPTSDIRVESCHVFEDTIRITGRLQERERVRLLSPMILGSAQDAMELGQSLALIRPRNTRFKWRPKAPGVLDAERNAFQRAARQGGLFDEQLAAIEPSPYQFYFSFVDEAGSHAYTCGDWEVHAMFWAQRNRSNEADALRWMNQTFNDEYPRRGIVFAIGNQAKRPKTWQLLGVIRLDEPLQSELLI